MPMPPGGPWDHRLANTLEAAVAAAAAGQLSERAPDRSTDGISPTHGAMLMDPVTDCALCNGVARSKVREQLEAQAATEPKGRTALVALQTVCP